MKTKYEFIIGGVHVGLFQATFPFAILYYNNEKIKIKVLFITIINLSKNKIKNIRKINDNLIKITTKKSREILFGCFNMNKLIDKLTVNGFIID